MKKVIVLASFSLLVANTILGQGKSTDFITPTEVSLRYDDEQRIARVARKFKIFTLAEQDYSNIFTNAKKNDQNSIRVLIDGRLQYLDLLANPNLRGNDQLFVAVGSIRSVSQSMVRLTVENKSFVEGLIMVDKKTYFIIPVFKINPGYKDTRHFAIFSEDDYMEQNDLRPICDLKNVVDLVDKNVAENSSAQSSTSTSCRTVEIATEADHEYFLANNSSIATTNNSIISILNQVEGIYQTDFNLRFVITFQSVWSSSNDPYSATNPIQVLPELRNHWHTNHQSVIRDLVFFFSGKPNHEVRGMAYLGTICTNSANSYAFCATAVAPDVLITVAHEIGHLFNATHPDGSSAACSPVRTIMCVDPEPSQGRQFYFASFSQQQISDWISNNNSCLKASNPGIARNGSQLELCVGDTQTFVSYPITGYPQNYGFDWYASSGILINGSSSPIYTTANSVTVSASAGTSGSGWVFVRANNGACTPSDYVSFQTQVGPFNNSQFSISGPSTACPNRTLSFLSTRIEPGITNYQWGWNGFSSATGQGTPYLDATTSPSFNGGSVVLRLTNRCGTTGTPAIRSITRSSNCSFSLLLYPNPASSNLEISIIDDVSFENNAPAGFSFTGNETAFLVDTNNQVVATGKTLKNTIEFDVRNVPKGFYVLRAWIDGNLYSRSVLITR
jgi:hypothetical protein